MAYDFSNVPAAGERGHLAWRGNAGADMVAAYDSSLANQAEDPIQSAINSVTPSTSITPTAIASGVDSLDQAITPIASDRTTAQLFSDFGAAPQQETQAPTTAAPADVSPAQAFNATGVNQTAQASDPVGLDYSLYGEQQRPYIDPATYSNLDPADFAQYTDMIPEGAQLGDDLTPELLASETNKMRVRDIEGIGLTTDAFTAEQLSDPLLFKAAFEPKKTEYLEGQRNNVMELYKAGDQEAFGEVYNTLNPNSQLNFLHTLYADESLTKENYLKLAGATLAAEDARLNGGENSGTSYAVINDYDTGDRLYSYPTSSGPEFAREVVLFEDQEARQGNRSAGLTEDEWFKRTLGDKNTEQADKRSGWVKVRDNVILPLAQVVLSAATGGMSDAIQAAVKGATGGTLHASDWLALGSQGMKQFGDAGSLAEAQAKADVAAEAAVGDAMREVNATNTALGQTSSLGMSGAGVSVPNYGSIYETAYNASLAEAGTGIQALNSLEGMVEATGFTVEELKDIYSKVSSGESTFLDYGLSDAVTDLLVKPPEDMAGMILNWAGGDNINVLSEEGTIGLGDVVETVDDYFEDYNNFFDTDLDISTVASSFDVDEDLAQSVLEDIITTNPDATLEEITNELSESFNDDTAMPVVDFEVDGEGESVKTADVADIADVADVANIADVAAVADVAEQAQTAAVAAVANMADTADVAEVAEVAATAAIAEIAPTAEVAAVAQTAATAAVAEMADTADVAEVAKVAQTAATAAVAEVAAAAAIAQVADTADVAEVAETAAVAAVAEIAPTAEVAKVAETAAIAAIAEVAETADVAEVAQVASVAATAAVAAIADVAATASVAEVAEVAKVAAVAAVADVSGIEALVTEGVGLLGGAIEGGFEGLGGTLSEGISGLGGALGGLLGGIGSGLSAQQAESADAARRMALSTRTTDSLFKEFEGFKTQIGSDEEMVKLIQRNRR